MSNTRVDEQMIRSYLLGTLSVQDTELIDELIFTDDDAAQQLRVVENELVDSYARGKLSGDALSKFESHYLVAPGHQQKVKTAQALQIFLNRTSEAQTEPPRSRQVFPWWLAAAAVLVIGLSGYSLVQNFQLRNQIFQKKAEVEWLKQREDVLQTQLNEQRTKISETEKELKSTREKLAQMKEPTVLQPDGKQIAFHLFPSTRSVADIPVLPIPDSTKIVIFNLKMEAKGFRSYRAKLKYIENPVSLWTSDQLKSKNHSLEVRMPTVVLNSEKNYLLEISGISADGAEKILTGYPFKVIMPN
jgi:hypothetical protein